MIDVGIYQTKPALYLEIYYHHFTPGDLFTILLSGVALGVLVNEVFTRIFK